MQFNRYKYGHLTDDQALFLKNLIIFSRGVQIQTALKAQQQRDIDSPFGLRASTLTAYCLWRSKFGSHPLAQTRYQSITGSKQFANNLPLIKADPKWPKRATIEFEGQKYKGYKDWHECGDDLALIVASRFDHKLLLKTKNYEEQINLLALKSKNPPRLRKTLLNLIDVYSLSSYDHTQEQVEFQIFG